ncbi:MAG: FIST C-terminal domain-containing protein [Gemmatimonadetes bacterium]|nr:FIST C-terminal domain-containing protein [Gemmatimonadota bacterium]
MQSPSVSALTDRRDPAEAAADLARQFGAAAPRAVVFFCSHHHDGAALSAALRARYPDAEVVGCTTAGEFTESGHGRGGVSALALGEGVVRACRGALARFGGGVEEGIRAAARGMEEGLGIELRSADASRYVGVVLVEGLRGKEEEANHALGMVAPTLQFVGGSAGDDLDFRETRVFHNGEASDDGAALLLMEMAVPFTVTKTCSFEPTEHAFTITRADVASRTVYEVDGRPVLEAYADAVSAGSGALDGGVFMRHPWGMMLDREPWIRSPQQALADGGLKFYCQIEEGMRLHVMRGTDLIGQTDASVRRAAGELGGRVGGGLIFNCILRRLELDRAEAHDPFRATFAGFPAAGFHTYGESYLGHINQTCTGLLFA